MEISQKYRERMFNAYNRLEQALAQAEAALPLLTEALTQQRQAETEMDPDLQEILKLVQQVIRANDKFKAALGQAEAGVGHLQESGASLEDSREELAHLATLSQYHELAPVSSTSWNRQHLERVELPVWEQALQEIDPDRLLLLKAAVQRVVGKQRG